MAKGIGSIVAGPLRPMMIYMMLSEDGRITAAEMAKATGISLRSIYRHVDSLRAGGLDIDGSPRLGYRLGKRPALKPLFLTREERATLVAASSGALKARLRAL